MRARQDFFDAGLALLAADGAAGLTIASLCREVGVSKGSFYHHFDGIDAYVQALLTTWAEDYGDRLAAQAEQVADPLERVDVLIRMGGGLHHEAERAIRAMARADDAVASVQSRADAARRRVIRATLLELGMTNEHADLYAELALAVAVGLQTLHDPLDRDLAAAVFSEVADMVTGRVAV